MTLRSFAWSGAFLLTTSRLLVLSLSALLLSHTANGLAMGWASTWDDILGGGSPRWKVTDVAKKEIALNHILAYASTASAEDDKLHIFCPLAGDDNFVHHAWSKGHTVTSVDLVPAAVGAMRKQFDGEWTKEEMPKDMVAWKHSSGRATLYEGNAFTPIAGLQVDAVYDKDSFGALDPPMRVDFCKRVAEYVKPGGIVYTEVKFKDPGSPGRNSGPPYHVEKQDLMEKDKFGSAFEYVAALGQVYPLSMPGMQQTGHILRRLTK